jgi:thiamine-phosphate pyrophosphorylase
MPLNLKKPIIYLITDGETTLETTPASKEFLQLLGLIETAAALQINLVQLREKNLHTRVLYELTMKAAEITRASQTRFLVNDRADVARAAGAAGVHLTARSIETFVIRQTFGPEFVIGVSTHSFPEAQRARDSQADFAVFGPVFETVSKRAYGEPLGLAKLAEVAAELAPFPVLALGGVTVDKAGDCFRAGASGIAAIRIMSKVDELPHVVEAIRASFRNQE